MYLFVRCVVCQHLLFRCVAHIELDRCCVMLLVSLTCFIFQCCIANTMVTKLLVFAFQLVYWMILSEHPSPQAESTSCFCSLRPHHSLQDHSPPY